MAPFLQPSAGEVEHMLAEQKKKHDRTPLQDCSSVQWAGEWMWTSHQFPSFSSGSCWGFWKLAREALDAVGSYDNYDNLSFIDKENEVGGLLKPHPNLLF
jgi:hypothetical protein